MKKLLSILLILVMLLGALPAMASQAETPAWVGVMDTIAESYTDSTDAWTVMDMAAYSALPGKTVETSASAHQSAINALITKAADENAYVSDLTKGEIVLRALGIDSDELYLAGGEAISNADALSALDYSLGGYYSAPWVLLAVQQGNLTLTETETNDLIALLDAASGTGLFESEWDGVTYTDIDTAMTAATALAPIYDTNSNAQALVDKIMAALPGAQGENGSFGSANTDAMVLIGLLALGEDPTTWNGKSVLEGMLTYVNPETGMFRFWGEDNALATEQAFRALVAYAMYDGEHAVNFYDFSANEVVPGYEVVATEEPTTAPTEEPTEEATEEVTDAPSELPTEEATEAPTEVATAEPTEQPTEEATAEPTEDATDAPGGSIVSDITVTVSIKTDTETWMNKRRVTIPRGSTVADAVIAAMEADGTITAEGAENGYIKSFTKDGETLAQFQKGQYSGWKYKVNGVDPSVSISSRKLTHGDELLFYYVVDYTAENNNSITVGGTTVKPTTAPTTAPTEAPTEEPTKTPELPFKDTQNHWATDAICWGYEMGLMKGVAEDEFAPEIPISRGMIVTILWRLEGSPQVNLIMPFTDVAEKSYYAEAVRWAVAEGIVKGVSETEFCPDENITREDLAVILYRYAGYKGMDTSVGEDTNILSYDDGFLVSEYAISAATWAVGAGIMHGRSESTLNPKETVTRAEAATILMRFLEE